MKIGGDDVPTGLIVVCVVGSLCLAICIVVMLVNIIWFATTEQLFFE